MRLFKRKKNRKAYNIKKVKNHNTWYAEVDGEEVEFEWVSYKYLIYEVGKATRNPENVSYDSFSGMAYASSWGDPIIEYYPEEDYLWVDTVMLEFIVREKTT